MRGFRMSLTRPRRSRPALALAAAAALLLAATGCSALTPGAAPGGSASVAPGAKLSSADVKALGNVTLRMTDGGDAAADSRLSRSIKKFEDDFPNVTVKRDVKAFADYSKTINLVMSGSDAPDVAEADGAMAPRLVAGKL